MYTALPETRFYVYLDAQGWFVSSQRLVDDNVLCYGYVKEQEFVKGSVDTPQPDQNTLASVSDADLAELGLRREQVEAWDKIIARQEQAARNESDFLDAMRDSSD
jgi:hypothetical protein